MAAYGEALRRVRIKAGLSQGALAKHVGVERTHITAIEAGRIGVPRPALRQRISAVLGGGLELLTAIEGTGPRAELLRAVATLSDEEAEMVREMITALQRHGWERSAPEVARD